MIVPEFPFRHPFAPFSPGGRRAGDEGNSAVRGNGNSGTPPLPSPLVGEGPGMRGIQPENTSARR
jgi:hypothetical protein